ncbi:outer membrane lipoprotein carrier protein LolA [Chelativorans sp. SCAU2101]|jgi:outer membrane lipoprotein-sorting protein|uniref:Outer membrane lipoprotein carrier protein LolA n=1 Tax=Chelativorans petroleitrophicus TaxID=2975484 RepID=A0A9X2X6R0_9HYPH|nr:outer membrane lipoprotein carrier protein LolA [Chelativorans petroleitrophicus]MCT8988742.1 outer membrane lipoprotein carrier protein LolA [Chelativorans petroleitrophicus]
MTIFAERPSVFRRAVPAFFALAFGLIASGAAHAASDAVQRIADHFSNVRTMTGEFVQFGPRGEQTGGKFYIERPGKIRFDYEPPARFRVISDGTTVVVENRKMNTADIYPLSKTPLKLLLGERIDLSAANVQSVSEEEDLTTVRLVDRQLGVNSTITMMFDSETYDLRQWTITDAQGKDTTVMLFNVQQGVTFDPSVFAIDYSRVNRMARGDF